MILAPMILLAVSPQLPTFERSPLASPETAHEWVFLGDDDDGAGWYDRSFEDSILFEGQMYPVVLVRFIISEDRTENVGDVLLAVDCTEKKMAVVAGWLREENEVREVFDEPEGITFDFSEPPFDDEDIILFKQACGQDWQP